MRAVDVLPEFREDTAAWRVPFVIAMTFVVAPVVGAVVVIVSRADAGVFRFLTREDSVLEWSQVIALVVAMVASAMVAIDALRHGNRLMAGAYAAYAAACTFIAGEEISWGQRIFGIETPEKLEDINLQGETTLHNIEGVLFWFNLGMLLVGLYGAVAPIVARRNGTPVRWYVPPLFLSPCFALTFLYKLLRFTVVRGSGYTVVKFGEWPELCLAAALAAFAVAVWRQRQVVATTGSTLARTQRSS